MNRLDIYKKKSFVINQPFIYRVKPKNRNFFKSIGGK